MGRDNYDYYVVPTCTRGVHHETNQETPQNSFKDARNLWCPKGVVETRPGYKGVGFVYTDAQAIVTAGETFAARSYDVGADTYFNIVANKLAVGDLIVGDYLYIGIEESTFSLIGFALDVANDLQTRYIAEYYDGTSWTLLNVYETAIDGVAGYSSTSLLGKPAHLNDIPSSAEINYFSLVPPSNWATTTVDSTTAYWIRFQFQGAGTQAGTSLSFGAGTKRDNTKSPYIGVFAPQFATQKRYIQLVSSDQSTTMIAVNSNRLGYYGNGYIYQYTLDEPALAEHASIAVIPEFDECFVGYNHDVFYFSGAPNGSETLTAAVEDRASFVGTLSNGDKAQAHPDYIPQLSAFPRASYIAAHKDRLFAAGIEGEPYTLRWSMGAPYHKVWPTVTFAYAMGVDNSPITGLNSNGEHLTLFKRDSIWNVVYQGPFSSGAEFQGNVEGLSNYAVQEAVRGVGTVSNASIQAIKGNLVFLAEDGIYAFDGQRATKLSGSIDQTIQKINFGRTKHITSAHWRTKNVYLLSVPINGSSKNNLVIVYDYKRDAFWLWDNIEAHSFLVDEDSQDLERIYFGDTSGNIFELGGATTDNFAAIEAWGLTHDLGVNSATRKIFQEVWVYGDNQTNQATLELRPDGQKNGAPSGTIVLTDPAEDAISGLAMDGTGKFTPHELRKRRLNFNLNAQSVQAKVTHNTKGQVFRLRDLAISYVDIGRH